MKCSCKALVCDWYGNFGSLWEMKLLETIWCLPCTDVVQSTGKKKSKLIRKKDECCAPRAVTFHLWHVSVSVKEEWMWCGLKIKEETCRAQRKITVSSYTETEQENTGGFFTVTSYLDDCLWDPPPPPHSLRETSQCDLLLFLPSIPLLLHLTLRQSDRQQLWIDKSTVWGLFMSSYIYIYISNLPLSIDCNSILLKGPILY